VEAGSANRCFCWPDAEPSCCSAWAEAQHCGELADVWLNAMTLALPAASQVVVWLAEKAGVAIRDSATAVALAGSVITTRANPRARVALIHFFAVFILETS